MSAGRYGALELTVPLQTQQLARNPPCSKTKEPVARNTIVKGQNVNRSSINIATGSKNVIPEVTVVSGTQESTSTQVNLDIWLEFRDLTYTVVSKKKFEWDSLKWTFASFSRYGNEDEEDPARRQESVTHNLLQGISGKAKDGEILAVMGPSAALGSQP